MPPQTNTRAAAPDASVLAPPFPSSPQQPLHWGHLYGSASTLALASLAQHRRAPLVVVAASPGQLQRTADELRFFLAGAPAAPEIIPFPDWECLPYDHFSPHPDIVSQRILALHRAPSLQGAIVLTTPAGLIQRLPPRSYINGHSFDLARGDTLHPAGFRERLMEASYAPVSQVMAPGEFAVRGGIIDLYPMGAAGACRIDLLDDVIDSIRIIDAETQRSVSSTDRISMFPAREFPMTADGIDTFRRNFRARFTGDPHQQLMYREVSRNAPPPGVEFFFPLFFDDTATLFDYLPAASGWVLPTGWGNEVARLHAEIEERFERTGADRERMMLPPGELYLAPEALHAALASYCRVYNGAEAEPGGGMETVRFDSAAPPNVRIERNLEQPCAALSDFLAQHPGPVLLTAATRGRCEALREALADHGHDVRRAPPWNEYLRDKTPPPLAIAEAPLERGLHLSGGPLLLSETSLHGERVLQQRRSRSARKQVSPESLIKSLTELKLGDPVVHEEHGVGRYTGLETSTMDGVATEFLVIEYRDGDKLYVPTLSLQLVSRYLGNSEVAAPLHKLGNPAWERARRRAREKTYDVAAELLEVEALRATRGAFSYRLPAAEYAAFAARFAFEETPDQLQVIGEVIEDMLSERPMDRLVCGDVGFGKTEIALRAAFLAVHNNKQVALLAPTTLLARQHYETFRERFAGSGAEVDLLSRFRTAAETAKITARLREGRPDIVIGTHRLLQKDVRFKHLGLVILDEEQRFGVRQKERLKKLRREADILTLSATPIPRTLNLALSGLRSISLITTPPAERLSIQTFVRPWDRQLIREACLREFRRSGQVYFLHNEVRTIERMAGELRELLPEAALAVAHGQMAKRELESTMQDFYYRRFNLLVCSTIIENGIDIPTANTILINRADRFGLAQLHQLRGRVGRSHHQAYAYLLTHGDVQHYGDAARRLQVIESLDELGVGYALASHDLEIRGAGELLGEAQSGALDEVGFTLYSEYLRQAIQTLSGGGEAPPPATEEIPGLAINLHVTALFPEDYLPDVHSRLVLYKRVAGAADDQALYELQVEMIDRFGLLPQAAKTLFRLSAMKRRAVRLGIVKVDIAAGGGAVLFRQDAGLDPARLVRLLGDGGGNYRMRGPHTLLVEEAPADDEERIVLAEQLIGALEAPVEEAA